MKHTGPIRAPLWWAIPGIVMMLLFHYGAFFAGSWYAFTDWNGLSRPNFVGLANFRQIFSSPEAASALKNTIWLTVSFVVLANAIGLALAVLLNRTLKSRHVLRTLFFAPVVISPLAVAYVWKFIFSVQGPLNAGLRGAGLSDWTAVWLGNPNFALAAVLVVMVWQFAGLCMAFYLAGLEPITGGELCIGGQVVNHIGARDRDVAMVFQNYALYPHMTIGQNIAFPLESRGMPKAQVVAKVQDAARKLGLTEHLNRRPKNLSGGQRQRVAMGRAIVREPQVFLMDEPLSNLDAKLRNHMRAEIIDMQKSLGVTTLYVTHDQVEAMTMGNRIAIMRKGVLQQFGAPLDLYDNPANLFVAAFLGSPAMNLFEGVLRLADGAAWLALDQARLPLTRIAAETARRHDGSRVVAGIRPEHLILTAPDAPEAIPALPLLVEDLPPERLVHANIQASPPEVEAATEAAADIDASAASDLEGARKARRVRLIARLPMNAQVPATEAIGLQPDPAHLHLFEATTGRVLM
ncbi:ATP-binding cassette domain-containing protein [Roseinatronobacter sp.]